jgi:hypothetical protein
MIHFAALRLMELETVALALAANEGAERGSTIDMHDRRKGCSWRANPVSCRIARRESSPSLAVPVIVSRRVRR